LLFVSRQHGAILIENLAIANLSIIQDINKSGLLTALPAEFKFNLNNYLSNLSYSPSRSLAEIIAFNNAHPLEVSSNLYLTSPYFLIHVGKLISKFRIAYLHTPTIFN
jgi:hypothetical protein